MSAQNLLDKESFLNCVSLVMLNENLVGIDRTVISALAPPSAPLTLMKAGISNRPIGQEPRNAIKFILLLNSLNYRFWIKTPGGLERYSYKGAVGAVGMRKAFDELCGDATFDLLPRIRNRLTENSIEDLFGNIPDPHSRLDILEEMLYRDDTCSLEALANHLADKIDSTNALTLKDAVLVAKAFPLAYADPLFKKAQLALAEIAGHYAENGQNLTPSFTVFADYQVPRVMRALGILRYNKALAELVDTQHLIAQGTAEETAIRSATVIAGSLIAKKFGVDDSLVDNYLWTQRALAGAAPFHLTCTTAY